MVIGVDSFRGTTALAGGVTLTLLNILFYRRGVLKQTGEIGKLDLDQRKVAAEVRANEPNFLAFYLEVARQDFMFATGSEERQGFWKYPLLRTPVYHDLVALHPDAMLSVENGDRALVANTIRARRGGAIDEQA